MNYKIILLQNWQVVCMTAARRRSLTTTDALAASAAPPNRLEWHLAADRRTSPQWIEPDVRCRPNHTCQSASGLWSSIRESSPTDELIEAAASAADSGNMSPRRCAAGCCCCRRRGRLDLSVVDRSCLFDTSLSVSQRPPSDWLLTTSGRPRSG